MPVTRQWVYSFTKRDLKMFIALSFYFQQVHLLRFHADEYLDAIQCFRMRKTRNRVFMYEFKPMFKMYASMLYVVDEGFKEIGVEDATLHQIRKQVDMEKLRRFRNATFHFQPHISNPRHDDYIADIGPAPLFALHKRQGFLIRKISRFAKGSPAALAAPTVGDFDT